MITKKLFNGLFPTKGLNPRKYNLVRRRDELIDALNRILPKYGINTHLRVSAFLGNCGIETDYFKTTIEYASGWDYDISVNPAKARGLGNFKKGDGPKFKGSGLSQTTGGYNFAAVQKAIGKILGIDVVKNPEILRENIDVAVESACIFWKDNNLNRYADRGEFKQLSAIVNRGDKNKTPLHWSKRKRLYEVCQMLVPKDFAFAPAQATEPVGLTLTDSDGDGKTDAPTTTTTAPAPAIEPTAETEKSAVKEISEKYIRHCPKDKIGNVCGVIAARAGGSITTAWASGLHGKILLIVAALSVIGFTAYALYYYLPRISGWTKDLVDPLLPAE